MTAAICPGRLTAQGGVSARRHSRSGGGAHRYAARAPLSAYYPILLGGKSMGRKYAVRGIPANFYLDPQGRLVSSQEGLEDESAMEAAVKAILPRAPAAGR